MNNDNEELNQLLASHRREDDGSVIYEMAVPMQPSLPREEDKKFDLDATQWSTSNGVVYFPTGKTVPSLQPGYYEIQIHPMAGLYFERIPVKTDGLLNFPDASTGRVISEIKKFWDREQIFKDYQLTYKRGIILWGPPGGGKSCTLQLVCRDVIERNGVVIKFDNPELFSMGYRKLRAIQPDTPIVVLMEDIDSTIRVYSETQVINILDGVDLLDKIVFLATTNYPELLGDRIMNRPSRFDKRFKVGYPNAEARKMYIEHLIDKRTIELINVDKWVEDTEGFSLAHLKELFVAVVVLGDDYDDAITTLKSMKTEVTSWGSEEKKQVGFRANRDDFF